MVKQKTIEDPNKEIWLLRVPSSISLDAVNNLPIAKEQGNVGDVVARSKGAARDHGGPVGRAFGGDIVIREESALADEEAVRAAFAGTIVCVPSCLESERRTHRALTAQRWT